MLAHLPHAASVKSATSAVSFRIATSALRLHNLRPGLTASNSHIRQRPAHTSRSVSIPGATPISSFSTGPSHTARSQVPRPTILVQRRHCSYQRNMCRQQFGTDVAESHIDVSKGREVLPKNVKPLHYRLTLEPNLVTFEFDGQVDIE